VAVEEAPVSKVTFDEISDFKFTAAYEAYSKAFDDVSGAEQRQRLNDLVSQLSTEEISYGRFYGELNQFREEADGREFRRVRIQGQRKRAYRRDQQERDRHKRHRR
jgi:hypothetical protein